MTPSNSSSALPCLPFLLHCSLSAYRLLLPNHFTLLLLPAALLCLISGCTTARHNIIEPTTTPLLYDDGDTESLLTALEEQYRYTTRLDDHYTLDIDGKKYRPELLAESIKTFQDIIELEPSPLELDRIIQENFLVFQAGGRSGFPVGEMLVTGYFEPLLQGSLNRVYPYIYPLYSPPADLVVRVGADGSKRRGRIDSGGAFQPYWTRQEIDETDVLKGHELVYLRNRFDAFLLHVQGSGKIQLPDGSVRSIQYRANNGHPYSSIGKLLVDQKIMQLEDVDLPAIRAYLDRNPDNLSRVLYHNKRYIFFGWGENSDAEGPVGSIGQPLTPGRSIAVDGTVLPMGTVGYLVSQKPVIDQQGAIIDWIPLQRFVLPQDSGSAIKGSGRADVFWGNGRYAEIAAGAMKEKGYLYFLIKNDFEEETSQ